LSGLSVGGIDEAEAAALALPAPEVLATSIPSGAERLASILTAETEAFFCQVARRTAVPHGTGDLLTALFLGHVFNGDNPRTALGRAAAGVEASVAASLGQSELSLTGVRGAWIDASPLPTTPI
jgi:pyridoxine kinase